MIEVEIAEGAWTAALADAAGLARAAALAALAGAEGEVAILLTSDEALRGLNARFLNKDRPTNVLAFPDASPGRLGDVALAFGICEREAAEQAKPLADHLRHLVVHGVLHLLGYDHEGDDEAARMEAVERELLAAMNVPDPYAEAAQAR
ncbi:MAG TPA: rRNA maturation RNase YbeY [Caulobacteraceae bacterium]|jgi:probable rRNA maturation factor|nr:rRNA maturation RNase YbeY [Caulobacteraceae bacterium]